MQTLKKSPFKVNHTEQDPDAFGLRVKEIIESAEALYNNRSILISGPRGIGKSSLGIQLQKVLMGNNTLLERCKYKAKFPCTLSIQYACGPNLSIEQIVQDLLTLFENEYRMFPKTKLVKVSQELEFNLGFIKSKIRTDVISNSPATIASQFVDGIIYTLDKIKKFDYDALNIMLDEVDKLPQKVNLGNFLKIVHETLTYRGYENVTFILAGQSGIFTTLLNGHGSFDRLIRHIPLFPLDAEASSYIVKFASSHADPKFDIEKSALEAIISLSSGHPDTLHLVGDYSFFHMKNPHYLNKNDVVSGVLQLLHSDKMEKYVNRLQTLDNNELLLLFHIAKFQSDSCPFRMPISELYDKTHLILEDVGFQKILDSLITKGHLFSSDNKNNIQFIDELFRLFITDRIYEEKVRKYTKIEKEREREKNKHETTKNQSIVEDEEDDFEQNVFVIEQEKEIDKLFEKVMKSMDEDHEDDIQEAFLKFFERVEVKKRTSGTKGEEFLIELVSKINQRREQSLLLGLDYNTDYSDDYSLGDNYFEALDEEDGSLDDYDEDENDDYSIEEEFDDDYENSNS